MVDGFFLRQKTAYEFGRWLELRRVLSRSGVFSALRRAKDVFVGFVTPDSASAAKLENLAYAVFRIDSVNGSVVLYGQKPYTELFNLSWDWSGGFPKAELRPIV